MVIKPAEAEKFKLETLALANKYVPSFPPTFRFFFLIFLSCVISLLEFLQKYRTKQVKEVQGLAEATLKVGMAEASVIRQKGEAEAKTMALRAEAWRQYEQGAFMETLIDSIPELVGAITKPLENVEKITLISSGDDSIGASKVRVLLSFFFAHFFFCDARMSCMFSDDCWDTISLYFRIRSRERSTLSCSSSLRRCPALRAST
jgi:hypothetical protein